MKRILIIVFVGFAVVAFAQKSETRKVDSFSGISVSQGIEVNLKKGDRESVRVEVRGTDPANVLTEVSGAYLKIHMRSGRYRDGVHAVVYVTYVNLRKIHASSAGNVFVDGTIKTSDLELSASSAGKVEATVDVQNLEVSASTAGEVEVEGRAVRLMADAATAGEVDADDLEAQVVEAEASSGGTARVYATKSIRAEASTGGIVRYRGNPDRQHNSSRTGGTVRRSN